jgi:hypothetical protein
MKPTQDPLRDFYKTLSGRGALPLDPDDPYYVPILQSTPEKDPILKLWQRIDWAESESVDLLTGFRGNGKSTELRRLKKMLEEESGCKVFLVNMLDFVLMTKPLELSDFTLSLMAALAAEAEKQVKLQTLTSSYWERLVQFLTSEVQIGDLQIEAKAPGAAAKLGLRLKTEPTFKERVQQCLRGHLTALVEDARQYVVELVDALRFEYQNPDMKVVLLVDSVEQLRGVGNEAPQVYESVVGLFSGQAHNLSFPKLHLVYTIPPYLIPLSQNLGRNLGGHPITAWPNVHVRHRDDSPDPAGLAVMEKIIDRRYGAWREIMEPAQLQHLAQAAGGDLRDFFRLVRECLIALRTARLSRPDARLDAEIISQVEEQLRNELLPLADEDACWLAKIHDSKEPSLPATSDLPVLARFLDGNLIMNYLNGQPWYDIHPLLVDETRRRLKQSPGPDAQACPPPSG